MRGALDPVGAICGPYGEGVGTRVCVGSWLLQPGEKKKVSALKIGPHLPGVTGETGETIPPNRSAIRQYVLIRSSRCLENDITPPPPATPGILLKVRWDVLENDGAAQAGNQFAKAPNDI